VPVDPVALTVGVVLMCAGLAWRRLQKRSLGASPWEPTRVLGGGSSDRFSSHRPIDSTDLLRLAFGAWGPTSGRRDLIDVVAASQWMPVEDDALTTLREALVDAQNQADPGNSGDRGVTGIGPAGRHMRSGPTGHGVIGTGPRGRHMRSGPPGGGRVGDGTAGSHLRRDASAVRR